MGCKPSKLQIQHNGDLFSEDTDVRKRFLTGLQASKGADGLEGNFQIVFEKQNVKDTKKWLTFLLLLIPPLLPTNIIFFLNMLFFPTFQIFFL